MAPASRRVTWQVSGLLDFSLTFRCSWALLAAVTPLWALIVIMREANRSTANRWQRRQLTKTWPSFNESDQLLNTTIISLGLDFLRLGSDLPSRSTCTELFNALTDPESITTYYCGTRTSVQGTYPYIQPVLLVRWVRTSTRRRKRSPGW